MKEFSFLAIFILVIGIVLYILLDKTSTSLQNFGNDITETSDQYKSYLSKRYILDDDTLKIIDYSMIKEQFTLSNGVTINAHIVFSDSINVIK